MAPFLLYIRVMGSGCMGRARTAGATKKNHKDRKAVMVVEPGALDQPRDQRTRTTGRAVLLSALGFMVLIASIVGYWLWQSHTLTMERARDVTQSFALTYRAYTEQTLDTTADVLAEVGTLYLGRTPVAAPPDMAAFARMRRDQSPLARELLVLDRKGNTVLWTGPGSSPPLDDLMLPDLAQGIKGPGERSERWLTPVFRDPANPDRFAFALGLCLTDEAGDPAGSVVALIDQASFAASYNTILDSERSSVAMVHLDGTIMARLPDPGDAIGRVIPLVANRPTPGPARRLIELPSPVDGVVRIVAEWRLNKYPLIAAVTVARDAVLAGWRQNVVLGLSIILVASLAAAALTAGLLRQVRLQAEAREALRRQNTVLAAQFETSTDGILVVDRDRRVLSWNHRFADMWGFSADQMAAENSDALLARAAEVVQGGRDFSDRVMALYADPDAEERDGTELRLTDGRVLERFARALRDGSGEAWGRTWFYRDVTRQRRDEWALREAKTEAEAANAAKSRFLAVMSHEIRTPMTGVLGMTDLLLDSDLGPRQRTFAATLKRSADTLLSLLDDILDFSKIEADQVFLEEVDVRPAEIVEDVLQLFTFKASEKGLLLEAVNDAPMPEVIRTDPHRLRQVLFNLVGNALKFTEAGHIRVALERVDALPDDRLRLTFAVRDTGIGLAPHTQEKLFQPFIQADNSTTRRYGGTGLGLAICKRLVTLMGGEISVESTLGAGATFRFSLEAGKGDRARLAAADDRRKAASTQGSDGLPEVPAGTRILLAEDTTANRLLIGTMLERLGCRVDEVADGAAALAAVRNDPGRYDLIVMDMQMPVMDGATATRAIRQIPNAPPVLGLTADAVPENRKAYMASGLEDLLTKPVDWSRLTRVVHDLVAAPGSGSGGAIPATAGHDRLPGPKPHPADGHRGRAAARRPAGVRRHHAGPPAPQAGHGPHRGHRGDHARQSGRAGRRLAGGGRHRCPGPARRRHRSCHQGAGKPVRCRPPRGDGRNLAKGRHRWRRAGGAPAGDRRDRRRHTRRRHRVAVERKQVDRCRALIRPPPPSRCRCRSRRP